MVRGSHGFLYPQDDVLLAPIASVGDVSLTSLYRALSDYSAAKGVHDPIVLFAGDAPAAVHEFSPETAVNAQLGDGDLHVGVTARLDDEPLRTTGLRLSLERYAKSYGAELLDVRATVLAGYHFLEATCTFPLRGRTIYSLHAFGEELEALMMAAADHGALTLRTARDLLKGRLLDCVHRLAGGSMDRRQAQPLPA